MKYYFGSQIAKGLHLQLVGSLGEHHDRFCAKQAAGVSYGLAVVACRGRDYASPPLIISHMGQKVHAASGFECAQFLIFLVLQTDIRPEVIAQGRMAMEGCTGQVSGHDGPGFKDVLECRPVHSTLLYS
jgi:hypothetical protein